jgi:hypothetical protein
VFTEPASNMATQSIGLRLNNFLEKGTVQNNYYLIPEIMFGISRKVMLHTDLFTSNTSGKFKADGGSVYLKYRFFSIDEVQQHFRMSVYTRVSYNSLPIHEEAINIYGMNSGIETGLVATTLLHKIALSSGASFVRAFEPENSHFKWYGASANAINYTISAGRLMLPAVYKNYDQLNVNLMAEFLGQYNLESKHAYLDFAPGLQFIIKSVARVDIGYRTELTGNMFRSGRNWGLLRLEYNMFNVW